MASTNTQTNNLVRMSIDLAATGAQDSTDFNVGNSPFRPGGPVLVRLEALDGTAKFKLEQAPKLDPLTGLTPATGSASWTTLISWDTTVATTALTQEKTLAEDTYYIRANVTTLHAASFGIVNLTVPGC